MGTQSLHDKILPAVILAAGEGSRLRELNGETPKPLTPLLGITLLERAILSCRSIGIREFYVVVGDHEERMTRSVEKLGQRFGVSIRAVPNPDWREGNGTSALASSAYVNGSFLLLMCDHLFDPLILHRLIQLKDGSKSCLLAVDRRTDQIFDLDDATKVRLDGNAITAIGKGISPFDGVDTGLFLCHPDLFDSLQKARREGDGSLTGGVQRLIGNGKIQAVEIGNQFWSDVDTPKSLSHAKRNLLAVLSGSSDDGYVARHLNRPISRRISVLLAGTPITANAITVLNLLICLGGALLFSLGEYAWTLLAGVLIQLASILDGSDGEIARLKFHSSQFGAWLDTVLDRYADVAIAAGISYGYWLAHPEPITWLGAIVAITGFILASYTKKEFSLRYQRCLSGGIVDKLVKRDLRIFGLFIGALLNRPFEAMILIGLLSHFGIAWMVVRGYLQGQSKLPESHA